MFNTPNGDRQEGQEEKEAGRPVAQEGRHLQEGLREGAPAAPGRAAPTRGVGQEPGSAGGRLVRGARYGGQGWRHQTDDRAAQSAFRARGGAAGTNRKRKDA